MNDIELKSIQEEFESNIQPTNGCWHWIGPIEKKTGRGKFRIKGRTKNVVPLAWEFHTREKLPDGYMIKQNCGVPSCVNPIHLELFRKTFPWRA